MRSLFASGILNQRETAWMGQAQTAFATTTPTDTATKETSWMDVLATGIKGGADAYGSYASIEREEEKTEGIEADAAAKAAALRTQELLKQTQELQKAQVSQQTQIMGIDKTAFFIGASLLGLGVIGGAFYLLGKKK